MLLLPGGRKRSLSYGQGRMIIPDHKTASLMAVPIMMLILMMMSLYRPAIVFKLQAPALTDQTNSNGLGVGKRENLRQQTY